MKTILSGNFKSAAGTLRLPNTRKTRSGYFPNILTSIDRELSAMLSHHHKVYMLRFDLHLHEYSANNYLISNFVRKLRKRLSTDIYGADRLAFIWCREQNVSKKPHYHLVIMVNGSKFRKPYRLRELITEIWEKWDMPHPHFANNGSMMVHRNKPESQIAALSRLSYLAKVSSKGNRPMKTRDFSSSRIQANPAKMITKLSE